MKIFKYNLRDKISSFAIPRNARILCVKYQYNEIVMYVLLSEIADNYLRTFQIFGTGEPLPDKISLQKYIGTVLLEHDSLVWHVFEITNS